LWVSFFFFIDNFSCWLRFLGQIYSGKVPFSVFLRILQKRSFNPPPLFSVKSFTSPLPYAYLGDRSIHGVSDAVLGILESLISPRFEYARIMYGIPFTGMCSTNFQTGDCVFFGFYFFRLSPFLCPVKSRLADSVRNALTPLAKALPFLLFFATVPVCCDFSRHLSRRLLSPYQRVAFLPIS